MSYSDELLELARMRDMGLMSIDKPKYLTPGSSYNPAKPKDYLKSTRNKYKRIVKNQRSYKPSYFDYDDAFERYKSSYHTTEEPKKRRGMLDRGIDLLSAPLYVTAGMVSGAVNDDETIIGNIGEALKSSIPFGEDYKDGEFMYGKILSDLGWNPESTAGRVTKGIASFGLDVLLDPLTYVSGGLSALGRGTGKHAVGLIDELGSAAKSSDVRNMLLAEKSLRKADTMPDDDTIDYVTGVYNKLTGTDKVGRDLTFKVPFGKKYTLVKNDKLAKIGDATVSPMFYKARTSMLTSKFARNFSNNAKVYDALIKNPNATASLLVSESVVGGAHSDMMKALAMHHGKYDDLMRELSPAERKEVQEMLENPTFARTRLALEAGDFRNTPEGEILVDALKKEVDDTSYAHRLNRQITDKKSHLNQLLDSQESTKSYYDSIINGIEKYKETGDIKHLAFNDDVLRQFNEYEEMSVRMKDIGNQITKEKRVHSGLTKAKALLVKDKDALQLQYDELNNALYDLPGIGSADDVGVAKIAESIRTKMDEIKELSKENYFKQMDIDEALKIASKSIDESTQLREGIKASRSATRQMLTAIKNDAVRNRAKSLAELDVLYNKHDLAYRELSKKIDFNPKFKADLAKHDSLTAKINNAEILENYVQSFAKTGDKVETYAYDLAAKLDRIGEIEVVIGKLKPEQLKEMRKHGYVPHIITKEAEAYLKNTTDDYIQDFISLPTNDYGFGKVRNEFANSRKTKTTIKSMNAYTEKELGFKWFEDDIAEILLYRGNKNTELIYDNVIGEELMRSIGFDVYDGSALMEGHKAVAKYDVLNKKVYGKAYSIFFEEQIKEHVISMRAAGYTSHEIDRFMKIQFKLFDNHKEAYYRKACSSYGLEFDTMQSKKSPLVNLSEDQYTKLISDVELAPDFKETALKYGFEHVTEWEQLLKNNIKQVPDYFVERYNRQAYITQSRDKNDFIRMWDKFTHIMKLQQTVVVPGWHASNELNNNFVNFLAFGSDAVKLRNQKYAFLVARDGLNSPHINDVFDIVDGKKVTYRDMYIEATSLGVMDNNYFGRDGQAYDKSNGLIKHLMDKTENPSAHKTQLAKMAKKLDPTNTKDNIVYDKLTVVGSTMENKARMLHYMAARKNGMKPLEAVASVNKFLFDYSDITLLEANVMKRIIPFYTYLRKAYPLMINQLLENPAKVTSPYRFFQELENSIPEEERIDRQWSQDWLDGRFQTPFKMSNGNSIFIDPKLTPSTLDLDARGIISRMNPAITAPLELASNTGFYFDNEIVEEGENPLLARLDHIGTKFGSYNAIKSLVTAYDAEDFAKETANQVTGMKFSSVNINTHERKARDEFYEDLENKGTQEYLGEAITGLPKSIFTSAVKTIGDKIIPSPEKYSDTLIPLTTDEYNRLSLEDKRKYMPPTDKEGISYSKQAVQMAEQEYANSGKLKKYVWGLFDVPSTDMYGTVEQVLDGDTFKMQIGSNKEIVRILMVDTPETAKKGKKAMPGGDDAWSYSKDALLGKNVKVEFKGRDAYGRVLGYVEVDGEDYNKQLIKEGKGQYRFGTGDAKTIPYLGAELGAKLKGDGVWSYDNYSTLWADDDYKYKAIRKLNER